MFSFVRRLGGFAVFLSATAVVAADAPTIETQTPIVHSGGVVLWVDDRSDNDALMWSGSENKVYGLVHSNAGIRVSGSRNRMEGGTRYVTTLNVSGSQNTFIPAARRVAVAPRPWSFDFAAYAPGTPRAIALGTKYFDKSSSCQGGKWNVSGSNVTLATGFYWVPCEVQLSGSALGGRVTIVATGKVHVSGSTHAFDPFEAGVSFATSNNAVDGVKFSGSNVRIGGRIYAPNATVEASGSQYTLSCGVYGKKVKLSGSSQTIRGTGCNQAPTVPAERDVTTAEDTALPIALTAVDVDNDTVQFAIVDPPTHGTLSGTLPDLVYTPATNYHGSDEFTYTATDGLLVSTTGRVRITVTPANDAPIAQAQSLAALEDAPKAITLGGSDIDGDALAFTISTPPSHGSLSGAAPNLVYTPAANYHGSDSFAFRAADGSLQSPPATVAITIAPVNDAPVAAEVHVAATQGQGVDITLAGTDVDGDSLTFQVIGQPQHGTLSGTPPQLRYQPDASFRGSDTLTYVARDAQVASAPATARIDIAAVNQTPVASASSVDGSEDTPLPFVLGCNDPDGDAVTFEVLAAPAHGSLAGSAPNLTFSPAADFAGDDELRFRCSDGALASDPAVVALRIAAVNDAPVAQSQQVTVERGRPLVLALAANDPEGDAVTFEIVAGPQHGALTPSAGSWTYTSAPGFIGQDSLDFRASDGSVWSLPARVTIHVIPGAGNQPPIAIPLAVTVAENQCVRVPFAGTDPEGDVLTIVVAESTPHGTVAIQSNDEYFYCPEQDFHGADDFTYQVDDGTQLSAPAAVTVTITRTPEPSSAGWTTVETDEGQPIVITLPITNDDDLALDIQNYLPDPQHGTVSGSGDTRTYTPDTDFAGTDEFGFYVSDELGYESTGGVSVIVRNINDAPVAGSQSLEIDEDANTAITLHGEDVDGDPLVFTVVRAPSHGVLNGTPPLVTYVPETGFSGSDSFEFTVADATETSAPAAVDITVRTVNDIPVATPGTVAVDEDSSVTITLSGTDEDGESLSFRVVTGPSHGVLSGSAETRTYTPAANYHGNDSITFVANDGHVDSDAATLTIEVRSVNDAPRITTQPQLAIVAGLRFRYDVDATDIDGGAVTFALRQAPNGSTIVADSGLVEWIATGVGAHRFEIEANDSQGGIDLQSFDVQVTDTNRRPSIVSAPIVSVAEHQDYAYDVDATDPDLGDVLAYSLSQNPPGAAMASATGAIAWSPIPSAVQGVREPNLACRMPSRPLGTLAPRVQWHWNRLQTLSSPAVAPLTDTNGDGRIDSHDDPVALVVGSNQFVDCNAGSVVAIDGKTGTELWSSGTNISTGSHVAVGDLEGDGTPEIVAYLRGGGTVAMTNTGAVKWTSPLPTLDSCFQQGAPSIADLDGDGRAEVLVRESVLNSDGSHRFTGARIVQSVSGIAVDTDLDGDSEVLLGHRIYDHGGTLLQTLPNVVYARGHAIVNLDADPQPEVVFVGADSRTMIAAYEFDGRVIWKKYYDNYNATVVTAGNIDADPEPEFVALLQGALRALDHDGTELWAQLVVENSHMTGAALVDLNGDERLEVVYGDELRLRVLDAGTGAILYDVANLSATATEAPVVVDVDGDGHAEILVPSDNGATTGLRAFADATESWVGTRAIWNQYAYQIDNVGNDLSIPRPPANTWLTHNTFRMNADPERVALGQPDLAVFDVRLSPNSELTALVLNRGLAPTEAATEVRFLRPDGSTIASSAVPTLTRGEQRTVSVSIDANELLGNYVTAVVDVADAIPECVEDNNRASAFEFEARATDVGGSFDRQRFLVSIEDVNSAPVLQPAQLPTAHPGHAYAAVVNAADADRGDGIRYTIVSGPAGMTIEPVQGELRWIPTAAQVGPWTVQVRATDLRGASDSRTYSGTVVANRPPVFTTFAPADVDVHVGEPFSFDFDATDPDGDPITYLVPDSLAGFLLNSASGVFTWTPAANQLGNHTLTVVADDSYGGTASQTIVFHVTNAPANAVPVFTTQPLANANVGTQYAYDADASDADGDTLTFALTQSPAGMAIDAGTGRITWMPVAAGSFPVTVTVSDGRGGLATQPYTITVSATSNLPPEITSTPAHAGKVGRAYAYDVVATDADGDTLAYSLQTAPSDMTIDAQGRLRWTPTGVGVVPVVVRVADAHAYTEQSWSITVIAADVPLTADVIAAPRNVAPGEAVTITLAYTGAAGPVTTDVRVDGEPVTLDASGQGTVTSTVIGRHVVTASVSDGAVPATDTDEFFVYDPSDTDFPVVTLNSPEDNAEVTAPRDVLGTVTDANLTEWVLALRPANSPEAPVTVLARGTDSVSNAVVGEFDPTLLINGQYALILQATDTAGRTESDSVVVRVTGDMKVGHFSITFEDVSIPVAGIPVRVTRTYDSRQRHEDLDFGRGWSVDYQNVRVRESQKSGFSWRNYQPLPGPFGEWCTRSNGNRVVTVTLPDGSVESFRAKAVPECTPLAPEVNVHLEFEAIDGTDSTLTQTDYGLLRIATVAGSDVYNVVDPEAPGTPVDPRHYRLTTPEGVIYQLDQFLGIEKITEPNGNTITYTHDGIVHSSGVGVTFVRDAADRISEIVLPDGEILTYGYDASGDLRSFADQLMQTSRFEYNEAAFPHYLTAIVDPRGIKVARNEYDDDGRLVATIDADGHRIEYTHDIDGRMEQVRDRMGRLQTFIYDDNGWVLSETNALGETTSHTYDADGNELTRADDLGHTTTWTYDARGNQLTETNHLGQTTTSTYDGNNNLLTQTDALGHVVIGNTYHPNGAVLTEMRDALGHRTGFGYDIGIGSGQTGELTSMTDAFNQVTRYELDGQNKGWRVAEVDAMNNRTTYTHDAMGRMRTETRTRTVGASTESLVTTTTYDDKGRVTRVDHPDGTHSTIEYNAIDKPFRECDRANRCTVHTYDARGNEETTTYPDGTSESRTYDANGNVVTQTDRGGSTTTMVYDEAGRLVETIMPDADTNPANNPRSRSEYDGAGRLMASVDENGNRTTYEYDDAGRRTKVIQPAVGTAPAATTITAYDAAGRRSSVTDAQGRTTTFVYDDAGRATETVFHDGTRAKVEYDALGRKTADIDPDNRRTEYNYDALGRLVEVTLAAGTPHATVTTYGYDEQGNRIRQTDAENRTTRFTHDAAGRELTRTLPLGQPESKVYDALGRLESHTDFLGKTTRWSYDSVDRTTGIDYPNDADVAFTYTASGQRNTATDGLGTQSHAYDARERLVRRTDAFGRAINYTYDAAGNLTSRTSANQSIVYTYDARNRMTSVTATVTGQPPRTTRYEYDQVGNRTAMVGADGVRTEYTYDTRYRLTNLVKRTAASALLFAASYTVDATGMRTAIEETDGGGLLRTVAYTYDALKRLTQEAITHREAAQHRTSTWTYDKVGNRQTQHVIIGPAGTTPVATTYTYDANDRLLTENTDGAVTTYTFDDNGNTISRARPGLLTEYAYDDANRLKEMREDGDRTTYAYDVDGLRLAQTTFPASGPVLTTEYLRDGAYAYSQVVEQFKRSGGGPAQLEAVLTFGDDLVAQTRYTGASAATRAVHSDGFGSTRLLTDLAASVTDTWSFDAFGNVVAHSGDTPNEHLFRGEQLDPNLGFYYLRARYYAPGSGRFLAMDRWKGCLQCPLSLNKYLYASSDPTNRIDPSGLADTMVGQGAAMQSMAQIGTSALTVLLRTVRVGAAIVATEAVSEWIGSGLGFPDVHPITGIYARLTAERVKEESAVGTLAIVATTQSPDGHHPIPVYLCGALDQNPLVEMTRARHLLLHSELYAWRLGVEQVLDTQFRVHYPIFSLRNRGEMPAETSAGWGVRALAGSSPGRSYIASLLDMFYATGWYASTPGLQPRFLQERGPFVSGAKTSLALNCARPPR